MTSEATAGSSVNWGELWDQTDGVASHTSRGIEFMERFSNFLKDRAVIEEEYGAKLRNLAKKYQPRKRESEQEEYNYSYAGAFLGVLNELCDLAGQHEMIAEGYRQELVPNIASTSKEFRDQRKNQIAEIEKLKQNFNATIESMYRSRKEYGKAYSEAKAAHHKFLKADANMEISRAELARTKQYSANKTQICNASKNDYAFQLQQANERQNEHYSTLLPSALEKVRNVDESRINTLKSLLIKCVEMERVTLPIVEKCLSGMASCGEAIDAEHDSRKVVEKYRSGYAPPADFLFEDLGNPENSPEGSKGKDTSDSGTKSDGQITPLHQSTTNDGGMSDSEYSRESGTLNNGGKKGGLLRRKSNKGLARIFGSTSSNGHINRTSTDSDSLAHLAPSQRCKKLTSKIEDTERKLQEKQKSREGLLKMSNVYTEQPKMGDAKQVIKKIAEIDKDIAAINSDLDRFKAYLADANRFLNTPADPELLAEKTRTYHNRSRAATRTLFGPPHSPQSSARSSATLPSSNKHNSAPTEGQITTFNASGGSDTSGLGSGSDLKNGSADDHKRKSGSEESFVSSTLSSDEHPATNQHRADTSPPKTDTPTEKTPPLASGENIEKTPAAPTPAPAPPVAPPLPIAPIITSSITAPKAKSSAARLPISSNSGFLSKFRRNAEKAETKKTPPVTKLPSPLPSPRAHTGDDEQVYNECDPLPVLGVCTALYTFDGHLGGSDGTLAMTEGQELLLVEKDVGDGWTRVRSHQAGANSPTEGFVPTTYLECKWYPNV